MSLAANARVILLDIEGTTTPVDFVFGTLFPYASAHAEAFLRAKAGEAEVAANLILLRAEYAQEAPSAELPAWHGDDALAALPYIQHLIRIDRKSTGLKLLQGKLWAQGYLDGSLKSVMFPDVPAALARWTASGKRVAIFSSGSVAAQKLIFTHAEQGDLTPHLGDYFDTTTGPKREAESYRRIAAALGAAPSEVLFLSDVPEELTAARDAGLQTGLALRPGNKPCDTTGFTVLYDFNDV